MRLCDFELKALRHYVAFSENQIKARKSTARGNVPFQAKYKHTTPRKKKKRKKERIIISDMLVVFFSVKYHSVG